MTFKVGHKYVITGSGNGIRHNFPVGTEVTLFELDYATGEHHLYVDKNGGTQFVRDEHVRPVIQKEVAHMDKQLIKGKAIYAVVLSNGSIYDTTEDRDLARMLKAEQGGLAKGVKIIRYAPVKEIR